MCSTRTRVSRAARTRNTHREQRVLLVAQVADDRDVEAGAWPVGAAELRRRLEDDARLAAQPGRQRSEAAFLQHDEFGGQLQRALAPALPTDVAVQIGAGQHQREATLADARRARRRSTRRERRACRAISASQRLAVPLLQYLTAHSGRQKSRPARRGVPVAVVGSAARA